MNLFYPGKPYEIDSKSNLFRDKSEDPEWVAEPKWNGWRAFITTDENSKITAYNSSGNKLSYFNKEGLNFPPNSYFDCEWVDRRTINTKNKLVVLGVLQLEKKILDGIDRLRRSILEDLFTYNLVTSTGGIELELVDRFYTNFLDHFFLVKNDSTIEGLVLKKETASLEISYKGQFKSSTQLKVKK